MIFSNVKPFCCIGTEMVNSTNDENEQEEAQPENSESQEAVPNDTEAQEDN